MLPFVAAALADPTARLAPGPTELAAAQAELEGRLLVSEAVSVAVARLQGAHSTLTGKGTPCEDPVRAESLARLRHFADRWHDTVQRVVVQADRLRDTAAAPTVAPIVDEERRDAIAALLDRADRQRAQWLETVAWFGVTAPRACRSRDFGSFAGLPSPAIQAADEVQGPAAVTALEGFVCPERGAPIAGTGDLVLLPGRACWAPDDGCRCEPAPVWPGAVLGPLPPTPLPTPAAPVAATEAPGPEVEEAGPGEPAAANPTPTPDEAPHD